MLEDAVVVGEPPQAFEDMGHIQHDGMTIDNHRPCTKREGHLCHIFNNLKAWNSILWVFRLELQEMYASELSLVWARDGMFLARWATWEEKLRAASCLHQLLTLHHCVVEATINDNVMRDHAYIMCQAILNSRKLKRITVAMLTPKRRTSLIHLAKAIASLTQLESLSLHGHIKGAFVAALAPILAGTSLTEINASDLFLEDSLDSSTVSICREVFDDLSRFYGPDNLDLGLTTYLRTSRSLTSLTLSDPPLSLLEDFYNICLALSDNKVLIKLELEIASLDPHYATPIKTLLNRNKTLKYFCLSYATVDAGSEDLEDFEEFPTLLQYCPVCEETHYEVTDHLRPWILALLADGISLKELTFSMWAFCSVECQGFLRALARNQSLERLTMRDLNENALHVCSFISEISLKQRVLVDSEFTLKYPGIDIVALPFNIDGNRVMAGHITDVTLKVSSILCTTRETEPWSTAIVQLIERTRFIRDLALEFGRRCCNDCWNLCAPAICNAVLRNPTIRGLTFRFSSQCGLDMAPLASLLHRSRTLRQFELRPPCPEAFTEFVTKLMTPEFENNHTLQLLMFPYGGGEMMSERLRIQNILQRNRALAKRAASYVTGIRAKYSAEAFETTLRYPVLIEKLETVVLIQRETAKQLTAESARRLARFTEFMCLAGVVRDSVQCNRCDGGKTQLADLPEECLNHVRQFLRLSDIRDPCE